MYNIKNIEFFLKILAFIRDMMYNQIVEKIHTLERSDRYEIHGNEKGAVASGQIGHAEEPESCGGAV